VLVSCIIDGVIRGGVDARTQMNRPYAGRFRSVISVGVPMDHDADGLESGSADRENAVM
jgi:hypothetical protein